MNRCRRSLPKRTALFLLLLLATQRPLSAQEALAEAPAVGTDAASFSVRSPFSRLDAAEGFLNAVAVQAQLLFNYVDSDDEAVKSRTARIKGLVKRRVLIRETADGQRTLELALLPQQAGYELVVYGIDLASDVGAPNPDLAGFATVVRRLAASERTRTRASLGQEVFQLSYIQSDRAIAALKALGYATVEFDGQTGETLFERLYRPLEAGEMTRLPVVVKLPDSTKTSLMDPVPQPPLVPGVMYPQGGTGYNPNTTSAVPDIGGTFLHHATSGEPQQRLLIMYDRDDLDSLARLVGLLHEQIDTPARQMVIEALVIEINADNVRDLGLQLFTGNGTTSAGIQQDGAGGTPLSLSLDTGAREVMRLFQANLRALVQRGEARVLSNPSVLVLDGRQARIQVGQQVPVVKSTATVSGVVSSVDYFPVGIVLNLRPRATEDGQHVSMQVETIVSAVSQTEKAVGPGNGGVLVAPVVDNRQVQSFVRVGDNTPFIIGGLIASTRQERRGGVPFLSEVPIFGWLFGASSVQHVRKEVIVVITPHIVPREERTFSYVIPKESEFFSSLGHTLFRNAYRVRARDRFDLHFVTESDYVRRLHDRARALVKRAPSLGLKEPYRSLLEGAIPGEEVLVRRMLWEIVKDSKFATRIEPERIIYFPADADDHHAEKLSEVLGSGPKGDDTLVMRFDLQHQSSPEHPFAQARAAISREQVPRKSWSTRLAQGNTTGADGKPLSYSLLLSEKGSSSTPPLDVLRSALMLKKVIELNASLPLTLRDFRVGREIVFPSEADLSTGSWVVDEEVARYFYEAMLYYPAFESAFKRGADALHRQMDVVEKTLGAP